MMATLLVLVVAIIHGGIAMAEIIWWTHPRVRRSFGTTAEFASQTSALAANQGLYNGFLVAGLVWALASGLDGAGSSIAHFFLSCVIVAGLFGAATVSARILLVQTLPAALALAAVFARL